MKQIVKKGILALLLAFATNSYASEVIGNIGGIVNNNIIGWACQTGYNDPITVHVYVGGPAGTGTILKAADANLSSEPAVATACGSTGTNHRFSIPLTDNERDAYEGQLIYIHGISLIGGANLLINNSGVYTVPLGPLVGWIGGVNYDSGTGLTSIYGWACNPYQTHIRIYLKEENDSDFRLHRQIKANDYARPDLVSLGLCDGSMDMYGYSYPRMVLSPGKYSFRIEAKNQAGVYQQVGNIYENVEVLEAARTTSLSNNTLEVRMDKMRGGLIDNIIDLNSGKHWLVNDSDGRGIGTSGMKFSDTNDVLQFNGVLAVETGSAVQGLDNDTEDQVLGDWGNESVTIVKGTNFIWGKAHSTSWDHKLARNFVYSSGISTTTPTVLPENTLSVSNGTGVRFDHEATFTPNNPNIIRIKEKVRNQSGKALKPLLENCNKTDCYPWPFTNQIHVNRFMLPQTLKRYQKNEGTWEHVEDLTPQYTWLLPSDLIWTGPGGVVVGDDGGAVGVRCLHENNPGLALEGYFVGNLGNSNILMIAPYWGRHLAGLSSAELPTQLYGTPIDDGDRRMSSCYFAFSTALNAVQEVKLSLDNATTYSWPTDTDTGF